MAKLVFLKRTAKEIEVFGGDVYFDIDGKNEGTLGTNNIFKEIAPGTHTIKMYKSHSFDSFIGFAESTIEIGEDEELMVKYSAPMMVNQPGNMIISAYSPEKLQEEAIQRDKNITRDFKAQEDRKKEQNEKYNKGVMWVIIIVVAIAILIAIQEVMIWDAIW